MCIGQLSAARLRIKLSFLRVVFCETDPERFQGPLIYWTYIFYLSKYYELFDTIIIVLKKKPLILLHYYHHILAVILSWVNLQAHWPQFWVCIVGNTLIHSVMYFYYAATALKFKIWWKVYLTRLQLLQFGVFITMGVVSNVLMTIPYLECSGRIYAPILNNLWILSLIWLFAVFYKRTYSKRKAK